MPRRSKRAPSRRFSALSFGAGLVVGVAVAVTSAYLLMVPGDSDSKSADGGDVATEDGTDRGPRYEFFDSLRTAEVATDTEPYKKLTPGGYVEPESSEYLVQAGAFRVQDDANRLRARLMLELRSAVAGMNADISISRRDDAGEVWHRVVVGPFSNKQDAEQTMASLRQYDVSPMLLQVRPAG